MNILTKSKINNFLKKRGLIIALEGIDKTGKTSVSKFINKMFNENSVIYKFPDDNTEIGKIWRNYISKNLSINNDEFIHKLFSLNRWEYKKIINNEILNKKLILLDRYSYSGISYSLSKGLDFNWCKLSEIGLIQPDITLYWKRDLKTSINDINFGKDIYENEIFQNKVKYNFENIINKEFDNIYEINVDKDINKTMEIIFNTLDPIIDNIDKNIKYFK